MIDGVYLTQLKDIGTNGGSVLHAMKKSDDGFRGFGEAYFSVVDYGIVRGWKRHREMTLNLVVPVGEIKFVLIDDGQSSENINLAPVCKPRPTDRVRTPGSLLDLLVCLIVVVIETVVHQTGNWLQ